MKRRDTPRPYVRIDNDIGADPKFLSLPKKLHAKCIGVHVMAIGYCDRKRTDGYIDPVAFRFISPNLDKKLAKILCAIGAWSECESDKNGYQIVNYLDWQKSKEEIEARQQHGRSAAHKSWEIRKKAMQDAMQDALPDAMQKSYTSHAECITECNANTDTNTDIKNTLSEQKPLGLKERSKKYLPLAENLAATIKGNKNINITQSKLNSWADEFRKLIETDGVSQARVESSLAWYADNIGGSYVPVIESGSSFRAKFLKLEAAVQRSSPDEPAADDVSQTTRYTRADGVVVVEDKDGNIVDEIRELTWHERLAIRSLKEDKEARVASALKAQADRAAGMPEKEIREAMVARAVAHYEALGHKELAL